MVQRPRIEDEVIERLNEKVDDVIRMDAEKVGDGEKVRILIEEYEELEERLEEVEDLSEQMDELSQKVYSLERTVDNPNNRL